MPDWQKNLLLESLSSLNCMFPVVLYLQIQYYRKHSDCQQH